MVITQLVGINFLEVQAFSSLFHDVELNIVRSILNDFVTQL